MPNSLHSPARWLLPLIAALALCIPLGLARDALADKFHLRDGRVLEGEIEKEEPGRVLLRMRLGSVWVPREDILRVEKEPPPREEYLRRKAALADADAAGWLELGAFCEAHEFRPEAEDCYRRALVADPKSPEARARLDALRARAGVEELLLAPEAALLEKVAALVLLEGPGRLAAEDALSRRARAMRALAAEPGGVRARIVSEFVRTRDGLRSTVSNETLYTDKAEATKERVSAGVRKLRDLAADPGAPEVLRLHDRVRALLEEGARLRRALEAFRDPPKARLADSTGAEAALAAAVRAEDFLGALNPHREANRAIREENAKRAEDLRLTAAEKQGEGAVNAYRELLGLKSLRLDAALCRAAAGHSSAMAEKGFFSHESPLPGMKTPYARIRKEGYDFKVAGENVAKKEGGMGAAEAVDAWIASPGHHRNLLVPDFLDIGIGVRGIYWTINMGKRAGD